jgi:DNA-binding Lrp family transcriptional regulator
MTMPGAIVLVNTDIGKETLVLEGLKAMREVESAYVIYGVYDVVVKVTASDLESLDNVVTKRIRALDGVRSTLTLVVSKEYRRA